MPGERVGVAQCPWGLATPSGVPFNNPPRLAERDLLSSSEALGSSGIDAMSLAGTIRTGHHRFGGLCRGRLGLCVGRVSLLGSLYPFNPERRCPQKRTSAWIRAARCFYLKPRWLRSTTPQDSIRRYAYRATQEVPRAVLGVVQKRQPLPSAPHPSYSSAMAHYSPRRHRPPPAPHPTAASQKLVLARTQAGLLARHVAASLGVHPRTLRRWEQGRTRPDAAEWSKLAAFYARHVPALAEQLAVETGVPSPLAPPPPPDISGLGAVIGRVADDLDVSPRRVRQAVREILKALAAVHGTASDLSRAVEESAADARDGAAGQSSPVVTGP